MDLADLPGRRCPAAAALELVGDRWSLLVVREVNFGAHRFTRIQEGTGAPRDRLAARLKLLVEAGVLRRERYCEAPERYEYHLTEAGQELVPCSRRCAHGASAGPALRARAPPPRPEPDRYGPRVSEQDEGAEAVEPHLAAAIVDVFVYVVVLNLFVEYLPVVISETFTLSLLTALLLKGVLEVVVIAKKRVVTRFRQASTPDRQGGGGGPGLGGPVRQQVPRAGVRRARLRPTGESRWLLLGDGAHRGPDAVPGRGPPAARAQRIPA